MAMNTHTARRALGALAALTAIAAATAGCGGSGDASGGPAGNGPVPPTASLQPTADGVAAGTSAGASATVKKARALSLAKKAKQGFVPKPNVARVAAPAPKVHATTGKALKARGVEKTTNEVTHRTKQGDRGLPAATAARAKVDGVNSPCKLVTRAEATTILKKGIKQSLAPQGPTCIYKAGKVTQVSLSIQRVSFTTIQKSAKVVSRSRSGKYTIYCLKYGAASTFVPLSSSRVLNVTGSCATGAKFARKALGRI